VGERSDDNDWAGWLARHGPAMVLFARQWAATRTDAEDAVQEAFVRFWRSRSRARDATAYMYSCVKGCAIDANRSKRRRLRREEHGARGEPAPLLACAMEHAERRVLIEAALRRLPDEQREVVVMKLWGGLTFPQIGAALQVSYDTAASRYRYAIAKLREQLAEEPSHG
jgi:RNA polymerase sigma-70 factor, ECF subfamily